MRGGEDGEGRGGGFDVKSPTNPEQYRSEGPVEEACEPQTMHRNDDEEWHSNMMEITGQAWATKRGHPECNVN